MPVSEYGVQVQVRSTEYQGPDLELAIFACPLQTQKPKKSKGKVVTKKSLCLAITTEVFAHLSLLVGALARIEGAHTFIHGSL
jgi:hypothetical protein